MTGWLVHVQIPSCSPLWASPNGWLRSFPDGCELSDEPTATALAARIAPSVPTAVVSVLSPSDPPQATREAHSA